MSDTGALAGRVALITGSGRGVGRELAQILAAEGASIVVNDLDHDAAAEAADAVERIGGRAIVITGDITEATFPDRLVDASLAAFGDLHILVNNAGYIWNGSLLKHTDEQWAAMLEIHATAPFRLMRSAGQHFRSAAKSEDGTVCRKVVNVTSISGYFGAALQFGYSAAKATLIGMTRSAAKEWGRYNVTVNAVALGYIDTRLNAGEPRMAELARRSVPVGMDQETRSQIEQMTPLGRFGTSSEGAAAVSLLCRPESDFISGQLLVAAGGLVY